MDDRRDDSVSRGCYGLSGYQLVYFVVEAVETLRNISFDEPLRALASVFDLL